MQDLLSLSVQIGANITGLQDGLNRASNSINDFSNQAAGAGAGASQSIATSGMAIAAGVATAVGVAIGAITNVAAEAQKAQNLLQASLGLTSEETKKMGAVARDVFRNNFGESIGEVTASLGIVRQQLKSLSDEELKNATENAYRLKDVFGVEIAESVNAVNTLMTEFGLSQQEANDFIAKGMQSGLNSSEDFLDTIGEYSNQFAGMKLSSSEFFSALQTGLKGGALGTDKIADSFKEFGIRIIDGSKTTTDALSALNISAKKVSEELANGKISKGDAFKLVRDSLSEVTDEVERNAIGVSLFGSQWEDLGGKAILSVDLQKTALKDLEGSTASLDVVYNDLGSAVQGVGRQLTAAFLPLGDAVLSLLNSLMPYITMVSNGIAGIGEAFNALPTPIQNALTAFALVATAVVGGVAIYGTVAPMLGGIGAAFNGLKATMIAFSATVRTASLSIAASISAAFWPVTLAVAAVAGLYLAYKTNFLGIRDFLKPIVDNIVKIFYKIVDGVKFVIYNADTYWKAFVSGFKVTADTIGKIVKGIGTILGGVGLMLYGAFVEPWIPTLNALQSAANGVANGMKSLVDRIFGMLRPLYDALASMGIHVGAAIQNALTSVSSRIGNLFGIAADEVKSKANEMAKDSTTITKGLNQVKSGINEITTATNNWQSSMLLVNKTMRDNLKAVPSSSVMNASLPATPTQPKAPTPQPLPTFKGADVDTSAADKAAKDAEAAAKKQADADRKAADEAKKAADALQRKKEAIEDNVTSLTRLIEANKRTVASGKMTTDGAIRYRDSIDDLRTKVTRLGIASDTQIASLLKSGEAYKTVAMNAGKAHTAAQAAAEAAKTQAQKDKERATAISQNVKALADLTSKQKGLVQSGKLTTKQAAEYAYKVNELTVAIDNAGIANNKLVAAQLKSSTAYIAISDSTAKAIAQKATQKKLDDDFAKRIVAIQKLAKDATDAELENKIKLIAASKDYKKEQLLEILNNELANRTLVAGQTPILALGDSLDTLVNSWGDVSKAVESFNDSLADTDYDSRLTTLETAMQKELDAVDDNEEAALAIKQKYAPMLLALETEKIEDTAKVKLDKLDETYNTELDKAKDTGADTTELTKAYEAAKASLSNNTTIAIAAARTKSAIDIHNQEIALDKKTADERIKQNNRVAEYVVNNYTDNLTDANTSQLGYVAGELQKALDFFTALGDEGTEAAQSIADAIENVTSQSANLVKSANAGFSSTASQLKGLGAEFDNLLLDPESKEAFVSQGLSGFDTLIEKYAELITVIRGYVEVLEGAGDIDGAAPMRKQIADLEAILARVNAAKANKATDLGNKFDADTTAADRAKLDARTKEIQQQIAASKAVDDSIRTSELAHISTVSDYKLKKLQDEKAAKLALADSDKERTAIELSYVDKLKEAEIAAILAKSDVEMEALLQAMRAELSNSELSIQQQKAIKLAYADRIEFASTKLKEETDKIKENADEAIKAQKKIADAWKANLEAFLKDMANAIGSAYATIYNNNAKLAKTIFATPEEKAQAEKDNATANAGANKDAGIGLFNAGMSLLSKTLPEFAWLIDIVSGLFAKMPQLAIVFQRVGEIFLAGFSLLEPVIGLLATVLEPLLNIMSVMLTNIIKPLLPILTFFVNVVGGIIKAVYGIIKTVWNTVASFLNGINILGWKPFDLNMLPELSTDTPDSPIATPAPPTGGSTSGNTGSGNNTTVNDTKTSITINVSGSTDPNEIASLVEKRLIKSLR